MLLKRLLKKLKMIYYNLFKNPNSLSYLVSLTVYIAADNLINNIQEDMGGVNIYVGIQIC